MPLGWVVYAKSPYLLWYWVWYVPTHANVKGKATYYTWMPLHDYAMNETVGPFFIMMLCLLWVLVRAQLNNDSCVFFRSDTWHRGLPDKDRHAAQVDGVPDENFVCRPPRLHDPPHAGSDGGLEEVSRYHGQGPLKRVSISNISNTVPIGYSDLGYSDLNPNGTWSSCIT